MLTAYLSDVPSTSSNFGSPSYCGVGIFASLRLTVAVCGTFAEIFASCACGVFATEVSTVPFGWLNGMLAKSDGRRSDGTKSHGPCVKDDELNQRPDTST